MSEKVIPLRGGQASALGADGISDATPIVMINMGQLRNLIHEEMEKARGQGGRETGDRLIDREEAMKVLAVSRDFLYRHGKKLGLTRKVGGRLKYSWLALQKYIASRKTS